MKLVEALGRKAERARAEPEAEGAAPWRLVLAPAPAPRTGPYAHSDAHLWDELARVEQLVRAQTVRWRLALAEHKPERLWGMIHVSDAEIAAYLHAPYLPPDATPEGLAQQQEGYLQAAEAQAQAIAARRQETPPGVELRLARLLAMFGLSDLERDLLLLGLLPELDGRYRRLYGYLQDDASRSQPSVELLLQIVHPLAPHPRPGRDAFHAAAPLLAHRLLVLGDDDCGSSRASDPLSMRAVRLDQRIAGYLLGSDLPDGRLVDVLSRVAGAPGWDQILAGEAQVARLQALAAWWREPRYRAAGAALLLHGPYGSGRLKAAAAVATAAGTALWVADVGRALRCPCGWETAVDLAYREAALQNSALYWAGCEVLLEQAQPPHLWQTLLAAAERYNGLSFLASQTAWDPAGTWHERPFVRVAFPMPDYALRRRLWEAHLPPDALFDAQTGDADGPAGVRGTLAELLANGFQLTEGQIVDALATARGRATRRDPLHSRLTVEDLFAGCRRQSGRLLITMARRVEQRGELTFEDLVLPQANRRQLDELRARIHYRSRVYSGLGFERRLSLGKGLIALFTGSSGTGKTMAAELLARERGVDLYKVDLSAVVSKYVGETEKNLSHVFEEAEDANAIIFFDEADALFGKRGEVKEARDRWANIEVNYLLQRIEEYAGVVILATNLRQNIDEAFMRRIHVLVEFPFPEAQARYRIWLGMFPPGLERPADAEIQLLAERFRLSGGSIKNVVLDAAFRALAESNGETPVLSLRHLVLGVARAFQAMGRPLTKGAFGLEFYDWIAGELL